MNTEELELTSRLLELASEINRSIDRADIALIAAGIAAVGSLEDRIKRLAAERDAALEK